MLNMSISYQESEISSGASDLREVAKQTYLESFCIKLLEEQSTILTNFDIDGHGDLLS